VAITAIYLFKAIHKTIVSIDVELVFLFVIPGEYFILYSKLFGRNGVL
jgi:hypothetical protein